MKSPREIALIRRASQLAGRGLIEAMKSTRPGAFEYQLDAVARYVFLAGGARLEGYRSITASGTDNIWNMHYYRNTAQLKDGDLVLMDFAPEYRYYTSDIARVWPVNGKYSPEQRELLQFVLDYRNAIMKRIRPGVTPRAIRDEAKAAMERRLPTHQVLEADLRAGGAPAGRHRRRRLLAPGRHGRPRRRRLRPRRPQAGPRLLDRPAAPRAGGARSISATRTSSWSPRTATRTSPTSCRPSSTRSRSSSARAGCSRHSRRNRKHIDQ